MAATRTELTHAASMVKAIAAGKWTNEAPDWADTDTLSFGYEETPEYDRAVQTAEAFILFFQHSDPQFDTQRFLIACGLVEPTVKRRVR